MLKTLLNNKTVLFWTLHSIGWLAYAVLNYFQGRSFGALPYYMVASLLYGLAGFIVTLGLRQMFHWVWERPPAITMLVGLIGAVISATVFDVAKSFIYFNLGPKNLYPKEEVLWAASWTDYIGTLPLSLYVILAWAGLYFGIKYYRMLQRQNEAVLKATNAAHQAQLKMLRYQLNPHFLFNTLNAISTLVMDGDTATANHMVSRLSAFLRHSLDRDPAQKVTLKRELDALNLYLSIEKIRFDERLSLTFDIDQAAYQALVPSLILQPLIENAIKYAIAVKEDGGTIAIHAKRENGLLCIQVSDDGPGAPQLQDQDSIGHNGVGLANTKERLLVLYGSKHTFEILNVDPHGLSVKICIPFEYGNG